MILIHLRDYLRLRRRRLDLFRRGQTPRVRNAGYNLVTISNAREICRSRRPRTAL